MSDTLLRSTSFASLPNWSVQYLLQNIFSYNDKYNLVHIGDFLTRNKTAITLEDEQIYKRVTIKINNGGVYVRDTEKGLNIGTKKQFVVNTGQFIFSKIDARNGAFGIVPKHVDDSIVTNDFPVFDIDLTRINAQFLVLIATTPQFIQFAQSCSSGTTNRQRIDIDLFLEQKIPLPTLDDQNRLIDSYNHKISQAEQQESQAIELEHSIEEYLFEQLGIVKFKGAKRSKGLRFLNYVDIENWSTSNRDSNRYKSKIYKTTSIVKNSMLADFISRGKSPKYGNGTHEILNQKCNRWNELDLTFTKSVSDDWFKKIDSIFFTKEGDVLVNSTGEGTIGRSTYILKKHEGLMFDSHLLLLRVNKLELNAKFYTYLFNSVYGQSQVDDFKSAQTTKQTELGISNLKRIVFPLPPLPVQEEIANHISALKQQIKYLKEQASQNRQDAITDFEKEIFTV